MRKEGKTWIYGVYAHGILFEQNLEEFDSIPSGIQACIALIKTNTQSKIKKSIAIGTAKDDILMVWTLITELE